MRNPTVTICGSTKFAAALIEANLQLTKRGFLVFTVGGFAHCAKEFHGVEKILTKEEKITVDVLHFLKIDRSDVVFVVDCDDYIGESTAREIEYAKARNVLVIKLSKCQSECREKLNIENIYGKFQDLVRISLGEDEE